MYKYLTFIFYLLYHKIYNKNDVNKIYNKDEVYKIYESTISYIINSFAQWTNVFANFSENFAF